MSCLFRSLVFYIKDLNEHDLRQWICHYLAQNPKIMDQPFSKWLLIESSPSTVELPSPLRSPPTHPYTSLQELELLRKYIQTMRLSNTWGGAYEIHAFCELFQSRVHVHVLSSPSSPPIEFIPNKIQTHHLSNLPILTLSWNGFHYEPYTQKEI